MDAILKALANRTRFEMMTWLKNPEKHFSAAEHPFDMGIPAREFERCGLSQSTVSSHLSILHRAGLLSATRIGQWTFYKRDEKRIADFLARLRDEL
jgi:ArsR family transcriptional regulator